ncbi:MAG: alpha-L-fucosidase [Halobacteriaceae archaeon]
MTDSDGAGGGSNGNDPDRLSWFRDLGLGLFVHWSVDVQLGSVISHSLVGASDAYADRYFEELPETFDPRRFDPTEWARLARVAGARYAVFTTKHHNGFAMWDTDTTPFNVTNTPYGDDVLREVVDAFRAEGVPVGFYFSPDDFWFLHQQGVDVAREGPGVEPSDNPELMAYNRAQVEELLTEYGDVATLFVDGDATGVRELAWELQPEVVVTRGAMETPEQELRDRPLDRAWEGNLTVGTQWSYKAGNERYKSGTDLIEYFVETRAKGGNLLLNVGPRPDGTVPTPQEDRLRELGLWNFVNREAVTAVRPCPRTREGDVWFTRDGTDEPTTVYAFVTRADWARGESRSFTFESVRATPETAVELLGQSGRTLEYDPEADPAASWRQDDQGLHVTATRAQRLYNADTYDDAPRDVKWSNPAVLAVTNARTVGPDGGDAST